jgi:hypothetical protein
MRSRMGVEIDVNGPLSGHSSNLEELLQSETGREFGAASNPRRNHTQADVVPPVADSQTDWR